MFVIRPIALQQIHERAQLKPWNVGPAATLFHRAQQIEQFAAIGRQAAAKGSILKIAMQLFQLPQQGQQGLGLALELDPQAAQLVQDLIEPLLLDAAQVQVLCLWGR